MVLKLRRFTRDEYHRMARAGVLRFKERVELIDGAVHAQSRISPIHAGTGLFLSWFFHQAIDERAIISVRTPLAVNAFNEPEPDMMLLNRRDDWYRREHPVPKEVFLVIELADTSLDVDLDDKLRLYARSGIQEYWVVDVDSSRIIVHRDPEGDQFKHATEHRGGEVISPLAFPDIHLKVSDCFG